MRLYKILNEDGRGEGATESALTSFAKFTGKQLCQSLFFNKVAGPHK